MTMKNWSGHLVLDENFQWNSLQSIFPKMWEIVSSLTKQGSEEVQYDQLYLHLNMVEINRNRKPIGYIRDGAKFRMIFPVGRKEIIIFRGMLSDKIREVTERVGELLRINKIPFSIEWDKMLLYSIRSRR